MITNIRIKNFKAIKDTGNLKLNPISCFIGYNGSGKSSLLEALLTLKEITTDGLDTAMQRWKGFENIQYKGTSRKIIEHKRLMAQDFIQVYDQPISFNVKCKNLGKRKSLYTSYNITSSITKTVENDRIVFLEESIDPTTFGTIKRDIDGQIFLEAVKEKNTLSYTNEKDSKWNIGMNTSLFSFDKIVDALIEHDIREWQFLRLNPEEMGEPYPQKRTSGLIHLNPSGNNVAEYLLSIKETSLSAYESILNTMVSSVLPYASDLQSELTSSVDRKIFLNLSEKNYKVPGWLLSTGTLRIVALLAVLRNPKPAPVVVIEELENGLDPRTIFLVISEIRRFTKETGSQVIFTSHSPYLLDLMNLKEIIFVEKIDGDVKFSKPSDNEDLAIWSEKFTPGKLYTMSRLNSR
ncbi:MAG: hypothetical protein A2275_17840 [Bacteroidetes bacterium RIFOXYA12_FULL_35_11]|nr:MAG: hypothetical protein A2X01_08285 [Bacteroidetes bacterium GWF2_35_48]OFY76085.1 MAG: hypothetical protein A2275_17840 [Bacteroidetes bacterium RIFOXYA12_FULL_35_11]HBX51254.1 chromosome segregation protein SMC [Bacteroidales bacterium]